MCPSEYALKTTMIVFMFLWIPEVLLKIFKRLCLFSFCVQFYSLIVALLKMVSWICPITQPKPKLNYYSGSLKAIQRPGGLSRNYFMDRWTKISPYSYIFPKGLLDKLYSSYPLYFMYILFILFSRISEIEFYFNYDIQCYF